eukprot:4228748-Karenia_brevis.AAC.1
MEMWHDVHVWGEDRCNAEEAIMASMIPHAMFLIAGKDWVHSRFLVQPLSSCTTDMGTEFHLSQ